MHFTTCVFLLIASAAGRGAAGGRPQQRGAGRRLRGGNVTTSAAPRDRSSGRSSAAEERSGGVASTLETQRSAADSAHGPINENMMKDAAAGLERVAQIMKGAEITPLWSDRVDVVLGLTEEAVRRQKAHNAIGRSCKRPLISF